LETLERLCRQFINEDYGAPQPTKIILKRSTFILEDGGEDEEWSEGEGSPRVYLGWNKGEGECAGGEESEGEDGEKVEGAGGRKGSLERLARFFGEEPEDGYQFAPQPPNVKMVKLKRIFGESVETRPSGADPEVKEYNKRYRDSLNDGIARFLYFFLFRCSLFLTIS
jgi:hypothetical protein